MHVERRINQTTGQVELWECEWENVPDQPARKVFVKAIGIEQPIAPDGKNGWSEAKAICWANDRTLGNIAVFNEAILGSFPGKRGADAIVPCDIVNAGKFRHGAQRWWCRTHQIHWGTKADFAAYRDSGTLQCANHHQHMNYVVSPLEIDFTEYAEVGIWCSMPAAISTKPIKSRQPRIHVHLRENAGDAIKTIDRDFSAIALLYKPELDLFQADEITRINVTPPAALEFVLALEDGRDMDCINCNKCGYPHLDLGDFAKKPHRKHFCGNCGSDSIWSKEAIVSTPLKPIHDQLANSTEYETPDRCLNIDEFADCEYNIWASTPAVLWTADRRQEKGIHVHIEKNGKRVVDDTFGQVTLNGESLERTKLIQRMIDSTI